LSKFGALAQNECLAAGAVFEASSVDTSSSAL
jgi:hypothetical protein